MAKNQKRSSRLAELEERVEELEDALAERGDHHDHEHGGSSGADGHDIHHACSLPVVPKREFDVDVSPDREQAILSIGDKWVNETNIKYYMYSSGAFGGASDQQKVVRDAFKVWKDVGIGLIFTEVSDPQDSDLRIGFRRNNGSWSYVGTYALRIGKGERTMNFGWDITGSGSNGLDTAIHEIGHALGFKHEHQNPNAGILWNRQAVYDYFARTQNPPWDQTKTNNNILNTLDPSSVDGSDWDPDSVMHYSFAAGLIDRPTRFRNGLRPALGLSDKDKTVVKQFYPPVSPTEVLPKLKPFRSKRLSLEPGEQKDFLVVPKSSRNFSFSTFGSSDTVMVLFEDVDGENIYVKGDDDSGFNRNARFRVRLVKGRTYKLRIRCYYNWDQGETVVMMW